MGPFIIVFKSSVYKYINHFVTHYKIIDTQ